MKNICELNKCTGCGACANICPKGCISMQPNQNLGHVFPSVNNDLCINCGSCKKVCPALKKQECFEPQKAYAGWFKKEDDYIASTSGGAATAFSRAIIKDGGVVFGCSINQDLNVCHIRVDNNSDLDKLRGSKYVQSSIGLSYKQIKQDLNNGKKVLFIGTPCQVAGLKSYIGSNQGLLYTIDLVCHGVPSNKLLKTEILKVTKGVIPDEILFRKDSRLLMSISKDGQEIYRNSLFEERYKNAYFNAFFDGFTYRNSCHECRYAKPQRIADITIGDFWGAEVKTPLPQEHLHGCSLILLNSAKGFELLSLIKNDFFLFERSVEDALQGNAQLRSPKIANIRIKIFKKMHKYFGLSFSYKLCVYDKIIKHKIRSFLK